MNFETGKFSAGEGLTLEEAQIATEKLNETKRREAMKEAEEDMFKLLTLEGAEALDHAIDVLSEAGFDQKEILDFIDRQLESIKNNKKEQLH